MYTKKELFLNLSETMKNNNKNVFKFIIPNDFMKNNISILNLNTRANNCLLRMNINTIEELKDYIEHNDLKNIRNLGQKSRIEIMQSMLWNSYLNMPDERKYSYVDECLKLS